MNQAERKEVFTVIAANVRISNTNLLVSSNKGFVRFAIRSISGGVNTGRELFVFDHRSATLQAAKAFNLEAPWEDRCKAEEALDEAIRQPAEIVVMEKTVGEKTYPYIKLYPTNGQKSTLLFSETSYTGKHNAGFEIKKNNSLWSWTSESSSRTGRHWEMVFVALTDETRKVIVKSYGYANIGHSNENLTVIGSDICRMSEADLAVNMQP